MWLGQCVGIDEAIYYMFCNEHMAEPEQNQRFSIIGIGGVKKWLSGKQDFTDNEFLDEAVKYISLMVHLYLEGCKTPKVVIYNNDVVGLNHKRKYSECKNKCIRVFLQLTDEGAFRVKRAFFHPSSKQ